MYYVTYYYSVEDEKDNEPRLCSWIIIASDVWLYGGSKGRIIRHAGESQDDEHHDFAEVTKKLAPYENIEVGDIRHDGVDLLKVTFQFDLVNIGFEHEEG